MPVKVSIAISKSTVFFNPSPFFYNYIIHYFNLSLALILKWVQVKLPKRELMMKKGKTPARHA
jgi:uncharacterized membrane protein